MKDTPPIMTPFDQMTVGSLQLIKALIPYVDSEKQKPLSLWIRFQELLQTMQFMKKVPYSLKSCADKSDPVEVLTELRDYCRESEKESIDMMIQFYTIFQMYQTFKDEDFTSDDGADGFSMDSLKMLLTPSQQDMFDTCCSMMQETDS